MGAERGTEAERAAPSAVSTASQRRLPPGYYVASFEAVLTTVRQRYSDLLTEAERGFLERYDSLPTGARRLFVRLLSRRGPSFRLDLLSYPEVGDLETAAGQLVAAGLADRGTDAPVSELLALLRVAELRHLAEELAPGQLPATARKAERIEALAGAVEEERLRPLLALRWPVLRLRGAEEILTIRLLFFGNLGQELSELVLQDLGVVRFEPYELHVEQRLFPNRAAVDDRLALHQLRTAIDAALAAGELENALQLARQVLERCPPEPGTQDAGPAPGRDLSAAVSPASSNASPAEADEGVPTESPPTPPPPTPTAMGSTEATPPWHPVARTQAEKLLNRVARQLERADRGEEALALYTASSLPPARERRARLLAGAGRGGAALALCRAMERSPRDESEAVFAPRFAHRLRRRRGAPIPPRRRRLRRTVELTIADRDERPIEQLALDALATADRRGVFAENWLWKSLFGLAFWDIVFAPVAGAFQHPFQHGPMDLHTPGFRAARRQAVERRLAELAAGDYPAARLLERWDEKNGTANRLVSWHSGARPALALALERLGGGHLAHVCDRLSRHLARYGRGLPDLYVESDRPPGFVLYEVKGPGDQLRPEQRRWLDYLDEGGLPTAVLKVDELKS